MSAKTTDTLRWFSLLAAAAAACTGKIEPAAAPLVAHAHDTQLSAATSSTEVVYLPGFPAAISIERDASGTPHIHTSSEREAYAALCYAMAEDRLFQLDISRRNNQGRAAELFGRGLNDAVLQSDRLARVVNIPQLAKDRFAKMKPAAQDLMKACSIGINYFISSAVKNKTLPPEFSDLGYQPEAWQPADSLAISMGVAMGLDTGIYLTKLQYSAIAVLGSPDIAAALIPVPPSLSMFDAAGTLNPPTQFVSAPGRGGGKKPAKVIEAPGVRRGWHPPQRRNTGLGFAADSGPESNNYAVDGKRTSSGRPLVANDPHLPLTTPTLAYAAQLQVDSNLKAQHMNVQGVTFPGFPLFVSARTDTTSWGVTFLLLDDVDLYLEQIADAASGKEVVIEGKRSRIKTRKETIKIAGEAAVSITVTETPHGPVLNAAFPTLDAFGPVALKTTMAADAWSIEGLMDLPRTSTWAEFHEAARSASIGFNFLFSDETGSFGRIGYQASGLVPLRQSGDNAFGVVPGSGGYEWTGFAKADELPSAYDPAAHVLATGNNRIVPDDFAPKGRQIYLSNYFDTPWRAQRVYTRLLNSTSPFNISDFASIQRDTFSVFNLPLRDALVSAIKSAGFPADDPSANAAVDALKRWDGNVSANSQGAAIYETLLFVLLRDTVVDAIGPELFAGYSSSVFITQQLQALRDLIESPRAPFFHTGPSDTQAALGKARDHFVSVALSEADALLRATLTEDVSKWTWGGVHTLTYNHPLAGAGMDYGIGSFPANGDASTPWIGGFFLQAGLLALPPEQLSAAGGLRTALAQDALQVVRVIWEPSSATRSLGVLSTGVSGDPHTSHYADQAQLWRDGQYLELPRSH